MNDNTASEILGRIAAMFFGVGLLGGLGTVVLQVFWYLQSGEWTKLSVLDGAIWLAFRFDPEFESTSWLLVPSTWIGVWKLLAAFPLSLGIVVVGSLAGFFCMALNERN